MLDVASDVILHFKRRAERTPTCTRIIFNAALRLEKFTCELIQLNIKRVRCPQQFAYFGIDHFHVRFPPRDISFPVESYFPPERLTQQPQSGIKFLGQSDNSKITAQVLFRSFQGGAIRRPFRIVPFVTRDHAGLQIKEFVGVRSALL